MELFLRPKGGHTDMISIFYLETGELLRNCISVDGENMVGKGFVECPIRFETMRWNAEPPQWVDCEASATAYRRQVIDDAYRADHGGDCIAQARRRLAIEAAFWLELHCETLCTMLVAEAVMRGVSPDELAAVIRKHDDEWIKREVARKRAKIGYE